MKFFVSIGNFFPKLTLSKQHKNFRRIPDECYIFGYGSEEFTGEATLELRVGCIEMITQEECESDLGQYMAPERGSGMFCAMGKDANSNKLVDACQVS